MWPYSNKASFTSSYHQINGRLKQKLPTASLLGSRLQDNAVSENVSEKRSPIDTHKGGRNRGTRQIRGLTAQRGSRVWRGSPTSSASPSTLQETPISKQASSGCGRRNLLIRCGPRELPGTSLWISNIPAATWKPDATLRKTQHV